MMSLLSPSTGEDIMVNGNSSGAGRKKKKSTKGWDGEAVVVAAETSGAMNDHDSEPVP
jgi:hypothetical protein